MRNFVYVIAVLSGIAGLGYQITWSRMFAIGLGHEMPSVLAVITAFFAGLAIGGWWLDRRIAASDRPARWYIALELTIAIWVLITIGLIPAANQFCFRMLGEQPGALRQSLVAFAVPLISLLPATISMGATLPAMDRFAAPLIADRRVVGGLYGANTLGAVVGTLVSAYWINPSFGYSKSLLSFAILNLICAALVWRLLGQVESRFGAAGESDPTIQPRSHSPDCSSLTGAGVGGLNRPQIASIAFVTGLLGIGFEVLGIRALSSVFANTVYTYAAILAVFLIGTALGGAIYQRWLRRSELETTLLTLLKYLILAIVLSVLLLANAHRLYFAVREQTGNLPLSEMAVAGLIFNLPTILMGVFFSLLAQSARHAGGGVGRVFAVNTIGSSLAPILFGMLLIPLIGVHGGLIVMILGYSALYLFLIRQRAKELVLGLPLVILSSGLVIALGAPNTVLLKPGQVQLIEKPGVMSSVAVVANSNGKRGLRVSNHFVMGGTQRPQFERIQGLLPILLHQQPEKALFLGVGTGITLGSATTDPRVRVTGVELVPEVVELLPYFEPENQRPTDHPRIRLVVADARRFIRASRDKFDVVVGDLYHPGCDGTGSLYTVEHFSAIRELLTPDGLACIWVPSYQTDSEVFRMIVRSYLEVFPEGVAYCGLFDERLMAIALVSDHRCMQAPDTWFSQRDPSDRMLEGLASVDISDPVTLLGHFVADNASLRRYAGAGTLNRDDLPAVTYLAPRYVYQRYPDPSQRFRELSEIFRERQGEFLKTLPEEVSLRLERYWNARDHYFAAMRLAHSDKTDQLLMSLQSSREFPEAYREAIQVAYALEADFLPNQAIAWLNKVIAARPESSEARTLLKQLQSR